MDKLWTSTKQEHIHSGGGKGGGRGTGGGCEDPSKRRSEAKDEKGNSGCDLSVLEIRGKRSEEAASNFGRAAMLQMPDHRERTLEKSTTAENTQRRCINTDEVPLFQVAIL